MVLLNSEDIGLRPLRLSDAKEYLKCHGDDEARANFTSIPNTIEEAKKEIREAIKINKAFAIIHKGLFSGFIVLKLTDHPRYAHSATVGYGISEKFRGRGIATQALKLVTKFGMEDLGLARISGMCRAHNTASARVLAKAGYRLEGTLHKNKKINGEYIDDQLWAIWR